MRMRTRIKPKNSIWYIILFPFLYPRGFSEYFPIYKHIMTLWLYAAIIGILIYFAMQLGKDRLKMKTATVGIVLYFGIMLFETLVLQGGISEGLQKIFATPALFMFFLIAFRYKAVNVLLAMVNVLIFDSLLNCTVFCPAMLEKMMGADYITNICFIGHVQMCAQIGTLGVAIAYLVYKFGYKKRAMALYLLSIATMLISGAVASYIASAIIVFAYILYRAGSKYVLAKPSPKLIFVFGTMLQAIMIPIVIFYKLDFGARYYVWADAIMQLSHHYVTGFGVYGVLIHTFWMEWTGDLGMNYAHNEVLQVILDGGIILLISYIIMCLGLLNKYSDRIDKKTRYWFNCFLIIYMAVGVSDSVTEYNYFYMFLLLVLFLPELQRHFVDSGNFSAIKNYSRKYKRNYYLDSAGGLVFKHE